MILQILHFFKNIQIILTDLPGTFNDFLKDSSIGDEGGYSYCFNSNMFDDRSPHNNLLQEDITR